MRSRRSVLRAGIGLGALAALARAPAALAQQLPPGVLGVYKTPWCGCCEAWAVHMHEAGFDVRVADFEDLGPVKRHFGVPPALQSCHTAVIDGYVVEGHVPAREVKRLLAERPDAVGLAVPDMPIGSPGMEQDGVVEAYDVILFSEAGAEVFASYPGS